MIEQLRQRLRALQRAAGIEDGPGVLPLGIASIDAALGGGLARGALHEIAAPSEAHLAAATGFVLGLAAQPISSFRGAGEAREPGIQQQIQKLHLDSGPALSARPGMTKNVVWIAEDMALAESGAPYGPGLDAFGLAPERLLTVAAARPGDLLWAMEEALRCRAIGAVIGEVRDSAVSTVALRRLSLAATANGALALLLRAKPAHDASTAATRWIVGAAPSVIPGREPQARLRASSTRYGERTRNPETRSDIASGFRVRPFGPSRSDEEIKPRFAAHLIRNRRGPLGLWILQWSDIDERFVLATHALPVAAPALDRSHRQVA